MLLGVDVSRYQQGIDMARVRADGMDFVLAKTTEGATYRSPAWPAQRDGARQAGLLLAAYHYVRTDNAAAQAANCRAALGDISIPVMLDWEKNGGDWPNFLRVAAAFRAAGLRVVLGYIPRWWWQQQGSPNLTSTGLVLVSSRYPSTATGSPASIYRAVTATTWSGYGGLTPTILQFTDRGTVAGLQVDVNAYLGSRAQLAVLLGAPPAPSPLPAPILTAATLPEDDSVAPIDITVRSDGRFFCTVMVEAGASSAVVDRAWITFGSAFGGAHFDVVCLDTGGVAMGPTAERHVDVTSNLRGVLEVPSGAVMATIEGHVLGTASQPAAALVCKPKP